jgi:hypothetical protein
MEAHMIKTLTIHKKWTVFPVVSLVVLLFIGCCCFLYFSSFYSYSYVNALKGFHAVRELREEKVLVIKISEQPLQYMTWQENFEKALEEITEECYLGKLYAGKDFNPLNLSTYAVIDGIDYWYEMGAYSKYCYLIKFMPLDV